MYDYFTRYDALRPEIERNIKKYRCGDCCITPEDAKPGDRLHIKQKSHYFRFGCNALMLGQLPNENQNRIYEQLFLRLFNTVTTTTCYSVYSQGADEYTFDKGSSRRPAITAMVDFARTNRLCLKGQPLLADSWHPAWLTGDTQSIYAQYQRFFAAFSERFSRDFNIVDVVNEAFLCENRTPDFPLFTPSLDYVDRAFEMAEKVFDKNISLEINENSYANFGNGADRYFALINRLLQNGRRVDSVGLQFHMFTEQSRQQHIEGKYLPLEEIYENYMRLCSLDVPLYISEVTIPSVNDPALQARLLDCLYHLWFSIPNMRGIIYWNFKDGPAWQNEGDCLGCLVDSELNEKPSYKRLESLLYDEWHTECTVDISNGAASFNGFYGNYDVTLLRDGVAVRSFEIAHSPKE